MTAENNKKRTPGDYYTATLENGLLQLVPYCACGNSLNEDFFCEKCQRKCRCNQIVCSDAETLNLAKRYIRGMPQFSGFTATLAGET